MLLQFTSVQLPVHDVNCDFLLYSYYKKVRQKKQALMLHQTVKMLKEGLQISLQSFQFYFILLQIFSLLLLLFLPVPGWCDPVFRFKGFGENQRIAVSAGESNTL